MLAIGFYFWDTYFGNTGNKKGAGTKSIWELIFPNLI